MKYLWFIIVMLLISGCERASQLNAQRGTPEYVAAEFFNALYNEKDLEQAKRVSTPEFAELLGSYGSTRQVARIMLNMTFDSVEISVNRSGQNLRQQYDTEANITLILTGSYDGAKQTDMRTIVLVKQKGRWVVSHVKNDPFSKTRT